MTKKILIVDDEVHIKMLLEQTLEELEDEFEVELFTASDGEEGLEFIRKERPDLVFLDIMMPKMNGYEVCRIIMEDESLKDVKIILLTAKGQEVDRKQGLELGAKMYMTKPFDPDEILKVSKDLLELQARGPFGTQFMTPLKKYIRPGVLRNFLRKAFELTGSRCPLAIDYEGEIVIVEGKDSSDGFDEDLPGVLCAPLHFDAVHCGQLRLCSPSGEDAASLEKYEQLLKFTAYSIQELIDMERARRSIAEEALAKYRELALLHRSVPAINMSLRMRDVVGALINECRRENYPGELGMVFISEPGSNQFRLAVQFGFPFGSKLQAVVDSDLFSQVVEVGKGEIVNNLQSDTRWQNEMPGIGSMALIPIISPNRCEGMLILASENEGLFEAAHRKSLSTLASVAGISMSNAFNFEGVQTLMNAILQALVEAIDSRDPFTAGHSERVAHLAVAFAFLLNDSPEFRNIRFSDQELREIYYSGILHDVGKIGIKEDVLTKKTRLPARLMEVVRARFQLLGQISDFNWKEAYDRLRTVNVSMNPDIADLDYIRELGAQVWKAGNDSFPLLYEDEMEVLLLEYGNLTSEERKEIQRHPAESERILQHIPLQEGYANMLTIIRQHHERMDGSGYPDGLSGDDILLQSRLMAIVDIYDAVTQERHYKPAFTRSEAMKILGQESQEGKLDKRLTEFFMYNVEKIEALSERVKSTRVTHLSEIGNLTGLQTAPMAVAGPKWDRAVFRLELFLYDGRKVTER